MDRPPFLQAYGALSFGDGTSLVIGITQDGMKGMGLNAVARLLACNRRDVARLLYRNTSGFTGARNDAF